MQAIQEVTKGEQVEIVLAKEKRRAADWTAAGVRAEVDRLLQDPEVDLLIAVGWIASHELAQKTSLAKPAIATGILDAEMQNLDASKGTSGRRGLSFIVAPGVLENDLAAFKRLMPMKKIAIVAGKNAIEAIPRFNERLTALAKQAGLDSVVTGVAAGDVEGSLRAIGGDVQGAYVLLADELPGPAFDALARALTARKLPSFSMRGRADVEKGLVATLASKPDDLQRSRRVAVNVLRIAGGEEPSTFPVALVRPESLLINLSVANAIRFAPTWETLIESETIGAISQQGEARKVSMRGVAEAAIRANLDLAADQKVVEAGEARVDKALSNLLPDVEISAVGAIIDEDRAAASFGNVAERSLAGEVVARQVIFAERAWANLSIQDDLQTTREEKHQAKHLDIAVEAARAYIDVLRVKTLERIRIENLKKTKSNLELARTRTSLGSAGPAEVHRWEAQIANDRRQLLAAISQRNAAEMQLNRMQHLPLEDPFVIEATNLDGEELVITPKRVGPFIENARTFKLFRDFMVEEAIARAPEIRALDAAIAALERFEFSAKASLFVPELGFEGRFRTVLAEAGEGRNPPRIPPMFASLIKVPEDDITWSVGLALRFRLFDGLADWAELDRASAEVERRRLQRSAAMEKIEQRVRTVLQFAGSSYRSIQLSRDAATAADKALEIVTNAYGQGAIGIIDLLDAQNAALVSDQLAVNASYDFMKDQLDVQRAIAWLAFLDPAGGEEFFQRAAAYFAKHQNEVKE